jgi:hypothetical protein
MGAAHEGKVKELLLIARCQAQGEISVFDIKMISQ